MKRIDLTPIPYLTRAGEPATGPDGKAELDPAEWLSDRALGMAATEGLTSKEQKERFLIMCKIDAASRHVDLEDAEWRKVRACLSEMKLGGVVPAFIELGDRVEEAVAPPDEDTP